jgi:hypothetical protein
MAGTASRAMLNTVGTTAGSIPSTLKPTPVPNWLHGVKNVDTPLLQLIGKASPPARTHNVLTWGWSSYRETYDQLAEALDDNETVVSVDTGTRFQIGDLIQVEDELMIVTGISTNDLTVIRGAQGSTAATHSDNFGISILGPATLQGSDTQRTPIMQGEILTNNWRQFEFMLDASHAREIFDSFEHEGSALKHFAKKLMSEEAPVLLEKSLISPATLSYADDGTEAGGFAGILSSSFTSNVDTITGALTFNDIMDALEDTWLASGKGVDMDIMGHPRMMRRISSMFAGMRRADATDDTVRLHFERFITPFGTLRLISNPNWLKPAATANAVKEELNQIIIGDFKDFELVPASSDSVWQLSFRDVPYNNGWYKNAYLRGMYSLRAQNIFKRTILKGYSVDDALYPGMV